MVLNLSIPEYYLNLKVYAASTFRVARSAMISGPENEIDSAVSIVNSIVLIVFKSSYCPPLKR